MDIYSFRLFCKRTSNNSTEVKLYYFFTPILDTIMVDLHQQPRILVKLCLKSKHQIKKAWSHFKTRFEFVNLVDEIVAPNNMCGFLKYYSSVQCTIYACRSVYTTYTFITLSIIRNRLISIPMRCSSRLCHDLNRRFSLTQSLENF